MSPEEEREAILQIIREKQNKPPNQRRQFIKYTFHDLDWIAESTEKQQIIAQLIEEGVIAVEFPVPIINPQAPALDVFQIHRSDLDLLLHAKIVENP